MNRQIYFFGSGFGFSNGAGFSGHRNEIYLIGSGYGDQDHYQEGYGHGRGHADGLGDRNGAGFPHSQDNACGCGHDLFGLEDGKGNG